MRTYREILQEVADQMKVGCFDLALITETAAIQYANQCCVYLRDRCYENAEIDYNVDDEPYINSDSILSTEIILP